MAATAVLALAAPSSSWAAGGASVAVPGRPVQTLSAADLEAAQDVPSTTYTVRRPGEPDAPTTYSGTSAAALATLAGVTPQNVGSMSITFPGATDGQSATLDTTHVTVGYLGDPAAAGAARFLVVQAITTTPDSEFRVFRPLDGAGDTSTNEFQPPGQGTLAVSITPVHPLVDVTVDGPTQLDPGQTATYVARTPGGDGQIRSVEWRFGDGTTATGASVTHAFATKGAYTVRAIVTAEGDTSGVGTAAVRVGAPDAAPAPGGGTTADGPTAGPPAGQGTSPKTPRKPPKKGTTDAPTTTSGPSPPTDPTPAEPTPAPATTTTTTTTAPAAPARAPRRPRRTPTDAREGDGDAIRGVLVAARTAAVVPTPSEAAAAAGARRGAGPRDPSDLAWILGPLAVVVLLGLGAARELRPRRRSLPPTRMPSS